MTTGYEPRWDLDLVYGEEGEVTVRNLLGLDGARVEVKRKRREDFRFYVETAQSPLANNVYKPSGINTSQADYWAYVVSDTGIVVAIPKALLKEAAKRAKEVAECDGDNPTKGRLVGPSELFTRSLRAAA